MPTGSETSSQDWFRTWFGESYQSLYSHRDLGEACAQVQSLSDQVSPIPVGARILDIGCGNGRHLEAWQQSGVHAVGIDLSLPLLREAVLRKSPAARADMRKLPFSPGSFDGITSFFSSFGYFKTPEEDALTLKEFLSMLKPGGWLFLDLPNPVPLRLGLVPYDEQKRAGMRVEQRRRIEEDVVIKDIVIHFPDGRIERHQERLRLHGRARVLAWAARFGGHAVAVFGGERGEPFDAAVSPRMAFLIEKDGGGIGRWSGTEIGV
jgi:SAM-dependent methyltransferase